jgi:hypothetical protein
MYSVLLAHKAGVICKTCGEAIEIEDDYIPGIRGTAIAASLYQPFLPVEVRTVDFVNRAWQKTLTCGNPDCGKTHEYRGDDLLLYDG